VGVMLVGAGPGDPALLTRAAADALAAAEVVVYDRPSAEAVVALAPAAAERHCVGLARGRRALAQDEVNALLVALGSSGRRVVRLKSGDPFVASRGGEEARALRAAGVGVEVVPGVSAALGAPAAAGIPLMVRQLSVTCTVVDGNDDAEHGAPPDWEAIARLGGTLVVLTGRGRIRRIAARRQAGGLAADTPVAAISAGTRPEQEVRRGTLADLPAPLPPPVTFVIGAVAALDVTAPVAPVLDVAAPEPADAPVRDTAALDLTARVPPATDAAAPDPAVAHAHVGPEVARAHP
jgi:uroporphyrin-III C-methyltransferase